MPEGHHNGVQLLMDEVLAQILTPKSAERSEPVCVAFAEVAIEIIATVPSSAILRSVARVVTSKFPVKARELAGAGLLEQASSDSNA